MSDATERNGDDLSEFLPDKIVTVTTRDGKTETHVIRESNGGKEFWDWANRMAALQGKVKDDDPASGVRIGPEMTALQCELIALCDSVGGVPVTRERAAQWGVTFRRKIFEYCQEQNGMLAASVESEGKGSSDAGSSGTGSASPSV